MPPSTDLALIDDAFGQLDSARVSSIVATMFRLDVPALSNPSDLHGIRFEIFFENEFSRVFVHYLDRIAGPLERGIPTTEVPRSHPSGTATITELLFATVYDEGDDAPIKFFETLREAILPQQELAQRLAYIAYEFYRVGFYAEQESVKRFLERLASLASSDQSAPEEELSESWKHVLLRLMTSVPPDPAKVLVPLTLRSVQLFFGPKVAILIELLVKVSILAWDTLKAWLEKTLSSTYQLKSLSY